MVNQKNMKWSCFFLSIKFVVILTVKTRIIICRKGIQILNINKSENHESISNYMEKNILTYNNISLILIFQNGDMCQHKCYVNIL